MEGCLDAVEKQGKKVLKFKESIGPYGCRAVIENSEGNAMALYSKKD